MANQDPGMDIGWLVSGFDARNSSITGTTLPGPNGSGQFLAVQMSTVTDLTFNLSTAVGAAAIGILQNKPSTGIAGDVRFMGISKAVCGSTAVVVGDLLMTTTNGALVTQTTGKNVVGKALAGATAVGQLFSAMIYGSGAPVALP